MKSGIVGILALSGLGVVLAGGCGGDSAPTGDVGNGSKRGSAGHGGSGGSHDEGLAGVEVAPASAGRGGRAAGGSGGAAAGHAGRGGSKQRGGGGTRSANGGEAGHGGEPADTQCESATTGAWVEVTEQTASTTVGRYAAVLQASAFDGADARIELAALNPDTGVFELGTGDDANLKTCQHCVTLDVRPSNGAERRFFADKGTLVIDGESEPLAGVLSAELTAAHFVEVTVDGDTGESSPVERGACVTVAESHLDVDRNQGSGGAGGQGGAGGAGGEGGGYPIPDDCIEVTTGPPWDVNKTDYFTGYGGDMLPNLGSPEVDRFALGFYDDETGTFPLGSGANATFQTCSQCILAHIVDSPNLGRVFFGAAGTIVVASGGPGPMSGSIDATVSDIYLLEMTPDIAEPLEGGLCLHLAGATITVP